MFENFKSEFSHFPKDELENLAQQLSKLNKGSDLEFFTDCNEDDFEEKEKMVEEFPQEKEIYLKSNAFGIMGYYLWIHGPYVIFHLHEAQNGDPTYLKFI